MIKKKLMQILAGVLLLHLTSILGCEGLQRAQSAKNIERLNERFHQCSPWMLSNKNFIGLRSMSTVFSRPMKLNGGNMEKPRKRLMVREFGLFMIGFTTFTGILVWIGGLRTLPFAGLLLVAGGIFGSFYFIRA